LNTARPLRIGINARFLVARPTGVQRAAHSMLLSVLRQKQNHTYVLFTGPNARTSELKTFSNIEIVVSPLARPGSWGMLWEQCILPFLVRRHRVDLLHSPANTAPYVCPVPHSVHVHDVCFLINPHWYSRKFAAWYRLLIPALVRRADLVVTNSQCAKADLVRLCGALPDKVALVYWGVDEIFLHAAAGGESLASKEDYMLFVGSLEPRKNLKAILEAYTAYRKRCPQVKTKLVIVGAKNSLFQDVDLDVGAYQADIVLSGFVQEEALVDLYCRARLLLYPSLYEGFGFPPLEAMAAGTPVLTSNTSSLPEVAGDAAYFVDPLDTAAISLGMEVILKDESLQLAMIKKGLQQVRRFYWGCVGQQMLRIFAHLARHDRADSSVKKALYEDLKALEGGWGS
jgi:glycosyltransferase involved in cell wall biosynthesis